LLLWGLNEFVVEKRFERRPAFAFSIRYTIIVINTFGRTSRQARVTLDRRRRFGAGAASDDYADYRQQAEAVCGVHYAKTGPHQRAPGFINDHE